MASSLLRRGIITCTALVFGVACGGGGTPTAGLAETDAGPATAAADPSADGDGTTSSTVTVDQGGSDATSSTVDVGEPTDGGSGPSFVAGVATAIELTADDNEMNTQPDDVEWGLLTISQAYLATSTGEFAATSGSKLLVVDFELVPVKGGNVFGEAFRLQAADQWFNPINKINRTVQLGDVLNDSLIFEVPESVTWATLHGGLPEELGVGRRTSYELTFEPGELEGPPLRSDAEVLALTGEAVQTSTGNEFNLQPDDDEWGILTPTGVRTSLIEGDDTASLETMLVVVSFDVTVGEGGNFFDQAFRLQADGEWYGPVVNINDTYSAGEVFSGWVMFEVPRSVSDLTFEAGVPSAVASYEWEFPIRTATYDITLS